MTAAEALLVTSDRLEHVTSACQAYEQAIERAQVMHTPIHGGVEPTFSTHVVGELKLRLLTINDEPS